ncbi:efflux RND transporter permease subunit [Sphingosinicella sp. LHD-64]|uniref:efflux RND transporter permease subunit n=1 Tax=Sphingosinicella sp. LHD-64 TaxID=3072139 RepID=UPI00280CCC26|nr:efflux RND transporter permease subunit [Sphingosinicella sp. LHD-64]MDQ8756044.1 efflux RND transporter permease subunit [Sphingosinicella sp. LHD-64]
MGFRNISAWSIRNPTPSLVLFLFLSLAGIISFMRMDVQNDPDIEFPIVIVQISQPGAAPAELETQVTQRVEAAVRSLTGIDEINSTVTEGNSTTVVQLALGTPIDRAVNDVRDAITQIRGNLPDGILEPQVSREDTAGDDIASFAVVSTDMTLEQLSWFVDNTVSRELLSVPGLAAVNRTGGVSREIRVILDPTRLQALGITAGQVNQQLVQMNLNAAGGRAQIAGSEQSMRIIGNALNAHQLGQTQIAISGGRTVKLADIAQVRDLYGEQRFYATQNGRQVLAFGFQRAKNESDVSVYHGAMEKLRAIEQANPGVRFVPLTNWVKYAEEQYHSAIEALIEGAALAVVVVFLFLRDWRATAISAIAIPLSAIPTFWFMELLGFSLNSMTLLALSLVAGVLVDDAIVEIENIVRHMRMGKTAWQASIDAADEIGLAVVGTTFSIVAVFLPVGLMPGVAGQFFKNFGFTVVAAVLTSLAVARLITPMFAAYFLKAKGHASHGEGWLMDRYMSVLAFTLKHRWTTVVGGIAALLATVACFALLPQTFQPNQNFDRTVVSVEMVPGTTLAQTGDAVRQVESVLRQQPEVEGVFSRIRVGNATIEAALRPDRERSSVEFERAMAPTLTQIPDARVFFRSQQGGQRDLMLTLGGDDPVLLNQTAQRIVEEMSRLPELRAPRVMGDLQRPEITIRPRMDLAANLGVTTAALSNAIRIATLGDIDQNSARFSLNDRQIPIRTSINENSRQRLSTIENLPVPTATGGSVPLRLVADIGFGAGPTRIDRTNQVRRVNIGADLAPGYVSGQAWEKIRALPSMRNLPDGVRELLLGFNRWQQELIRDFMIAVGSGVFLVFSVLLLLYHRILPPFVNMGSLLLAPLGGLLALMIVGQPVSLPVYIGLLMLLGIVAKNSILLIDFALEEMGKGVPKYEAILDAGHKRAQPIVMTTVAMTAGMIPTAVSLSGDAAWRAPMGIVVMGGLILSTVLTLVLVPGTFSLALGVEERLGPRLSRWFTTGGKDARPPAPEPAE